MKIKLNGSWKEYPERLSVDAFLDKEEIRRDYMAVERNGKVLRKRLFPSILLEEGDVLEIIKLVGGG